jgi:hypothetical protein
MKNFTIVLITFFTFSSVLTSQNVFDKNFEDASLRIDFTLAGDKDTETAYLTEIKKEPFWGGTKKNLIDRFDYGTYRLYVSDKNSGDTLYTAGFCSLFEEWQTTEEAKNDPKAFYQSVTIPFPKNDVTVEIKRRQRNGTLTQLLKTDISPDTYSVIKEKPVSADVVKIVDNGSSDKNVDIVFVADGYTKEEMDKYISDIKMLTDYLFSFPPYDKYKDKFNIWAVKSVSQESGCDDPRKNIWVNTAVNSSFNTFNSDRYLESLDVKSIRDYAANAPYDQIYVLVNTEKYGGGGIYNHFSLTSAGNDYSKQVFIHEFGHAFAGLGDEYFYTNDNTYSDFFDLKTEPWQPNLTTLVDFDSKWKSMLAKDTPIPTPSTDTLDVGVYEGAGYVAKGMYRPAIDCRMKTNTAKGFCPVCRKAISDLILFLSDE